MVDYNRLAATANRLINTNGRDVTIVKKDRTAANPTQPWRAPDTNDTTLGPLKAVIIPFEEKDVDGTLVRRGDRRCFVSATSVGVNLLEEFDELIDNTEIWKIVSVTIINPGPIRVLYDLSLRK